MAKLGVSRSTFGTPVTTREAEAMSNTPDVGPAQAQGPTPQQPVPPQAVPPGGWPQQPVPPYGAPPPQGWPQQGWPPQPPAKSGGCSPIVIGCIVAVILVLVVLPIIAVMLLFLASNGLQTTLSNMGNQL